MISNSQGANFKGLSPADPDGTQNVAPGLRWMAPITR